MRFWLADPCPVAALQLAVEYGASGGEFAGHGMGVECEPLAGTFSSINDRDEQRVVHMAFISLKGLSGPVDLARCRYDLGSAGGARFTIRVVDASDTALRPVYPPPAIGYRVE